MGKTIVCSSIEEMCNLMCDNYYDEDQIIEDEDIADNGENEE